MSSHGDSSGKDFRRAFIVGIVLNTGFIAFELLFGILGASLALIADAGHNLSDVLGLLLAWGASSLEKLTPTRKRTYGWRSSTIMAAVLNAVLLLIAVGAIFLEAVQRLANPSPAAGMTIVIVAAVGVVINALTAFLFMAGRGRDLNIRGAFLHMAADAGVSAGVVMAGVGIWATGWLWLDPVVSMLIALVIFLSSWGLLRDSVNLSLMAVPKDIDTRAVEHYLQSLPGVEAVHDLHIWALSTTDVALTAHLVKPEPENDDGLIRRLETELKQKFDISHITIQWERKSDPEQCSLRCEINS